MQRKLLGQQAESLAKKHLQNKSYHFVTQNFRTKFGEIDLIFLSPDKSTIVFIEVKARHQVNLGLPEEAVTPEKLKTITKVSEYFLQTHPDFPQLARIDVIAIELDQSPLKIRHIKNASV